MLLKGRLIFLASLGVGIPLYFFLRFDVPPTIAFQSLVRFCRATYIATLIGFDFKYSFKEIERGDPEFERVLSEVSARSAARLLWLCRKNRGIYTKAGQHIASLNHVAPAEFIETLSVLQDQADSLPLSVVRSVIEAEIGGKIKDVFSEFDETALAAASLAQVHRAVIRDTGQEVAVKVQYNDVAQMFEGDIFTIRFLVGALGYFFENYDLKWIVDEFEPALKQELDFELEGRNSERTKRNFKEWKQIYVPEVIWDLSGRTVLTMEFIRGLKISDTEGMKRAGISRAEASKLVVDCFAEQIYVHGWIHSDPHPGNLLLRKRDGKTQLVVLDHGLYREFKDPHRTWYCHFWNALVLRDTPNIEKYGRLLGAGDYWNILSVLLIFRPPGNNDVGLTKKMSKADLEEIRGMMVKLGLKEGGEGGERGVQKGLVERGGVAPEVGEVVNAEDEDLRDALSGAVSGDLTNRRRKHRGAGFKLVNDLLQSLSRDLLFVLRTTNLVRSANKQMGDTVNRFQQFARAAVRGLAVTKNGAEGIDGTDEIVDGVVGRGQSVILWWNMVKFELALFLWDWIDRTLTYLLGRKFQPALDSRHPDE
eukprot:TRINITY_DN6039_c0_g1_i1.p1 TRINITY_DN6039_c0_g1~~TRINITY_DN6039_c0_g1_i1.p1  ORF type:complete len:592 (-),score=108.16 TRINITY_DN6039_c0_g1_i1:249-2024(-)